MCNLDVLYNLEIKYTHIIPEIEILVKCFFKKFMLKRRNALRRTYVKIKQPLPIHCIFESKPHKVRISTIQKLRNSRKSVINKQLTIIHSKPNQRSNRTHKKAWSPAIPSTIISKDGKIEHTPKWNTDLQLYNSSLIAVIRKVMYTILS